MIRFTLEIFKLRPTWGSAANMPPKLAPQPKINGDPKLESQAMKEFHLAHQRDFQSSSMTKKATKLR